VKAMVLEKTGPAEDNPLTLRELPDPHPAAGEVRLRIRVCGVCHTDLHVIEGDLALPKLPLIPGHEIIGVVDEVGEGTKRFREGDTAGAAWLYSTCGNCGFCKRGQENLCQSARFTGYSADGGFAEYFVVPEAFAYRVPQGFDNAEAAPLMCAGIIGFRALRLSDIKPGRRLGLYGFGASAHIAIQVARHWGCEVFVFTRSQEHRRLAKQLGAAWVGGAEDEPPAKLDSAIIFAPAGPLVPAALRVLEKGGTLALAGIHMSPIPEMPYELLYGERTIRSVANSTRTDGEELLALAAEIPVRTEVETFRLEDANRVLQLLKHSRLRAAGVLQVA